MKKADVKGFRVLEKMMTEDEYIDKMKVDWNYTRSKRATKTHFAFPDSENLRYFIAVATSPEKYKDKIVAFSGIGEYPDLIVDTGDYTLGGNAIKKFGVPEDADYRGMGIITALRERRDELAESLATTKPFVIVLSNPESTYLKNKESYHPRHEGIPDWARERIGDTLLYYVYNPLDTLEKSFNTVWGNIIKMVNAGVAYRYDADVAIEKPDGSLAADWIQREDAKAFIDEMILRGFKVTTRDKGAYLRVTVEQE